MERFCEFCKTSRPVVHCTSDAANLCLSCDAKVHSANALSSRHFRTLLCDSCRYRPSCVRCLEHKMFLCSCCDSNLHDASNSQHQKRNVSSYLGCPSAKDFAALWGFEVNEQDNNGHDLSSCQNSKVVLNAQQQQGNSFILQQILDLKRLQVTGEGCREEQTDTRTSVHKHCKKNGGNVGQTSQNMQSIVTNLHQRNNKLQELEVNSFSLPFTHLEHLSSSSTAGMPLQGDSAYWQSKSPIQSNQLWSQTMQDLGVCEDNSSRDDFNMPDVDLTFRNFEDVFGGGANQDPIQVLLDDKDNSCSSVENEMSFDNTSYGNAIPLEDASAASIYAAQSAQMERDWNNSSQIHNYPQNFDFSHPIQPPFSTMSFSLSRFSNESNGTDFQDCELSPVSAWEASSNSNDLDGVHTEARENAMMRYKEKKKARLHDRKVRYASQKTKSDIRKKIRG